MIKRYNDFVKGRVNEEVELENEAPFVEEPIADTDESDLEIEDSPVSEVEEVSETPASELPEEEGGEYQGQILLNQLANELGTEVSEDGSINYNGKKINFFSETEKFHVDNKKFATVEEVVDYLGKSEPEISNEMTPEEENEMTGELEGEKKVGLDDIDEDEFEKGDDAFESKSYRHTRLKKFGK